MKSRIRSRWHKANEKPLEKNGSTVQVAPVGEIDPNHLANLTDDLSNFKPAQISDEKPKRTERGNDHRKGRSKSGKRRPDDRHSERKSRSNEGNQTEQERDSAKASGNHKRRPRKRRNLQGKQTSGHSKNSNKRAQSSSKSDTKPSEKASGLKGFLGKLFG
jgi:hypothetical protein